MDLVIAMVPYLDKQSIGSVYQTILPWLQVSLLKFHCSVKSGFLYR